VARQDEKRADPIRSRFQNQKGSCAATPSGILRAEP
jgi:hypothetical protein